MDVQGGGGGGASNAPAQGRRASFSGPGYAGIGSRSRRGSLVSMSSVGSSSSPVDDLLSPSAASVTSNNSYSFGRFGSIGSSAASGSLSFTCTCLNVTVYVARRGKLSEEDRASLHNFSFPAGVFGIIDTVRLFILCLLSQPPLLPHIGTFHLKFVPALLSLCAEPPV